MKWLEIHIDTNHAGLEPVSAMLSALGIDGVAIDDETEFQEFLENNRQYWDYVDEELSRRMEGVSRVTFYLQADEEGFARMGEIRVALERLRAERQDCGSLIMSLDSLEDEDWENNWKQYYRPVEIGRRLMVIPQWEEEQGRKQAESAGRVPLLLDPGLTFGTGEHATTRLCLTALEEAVHGGERVLDLGCGSGILSIAALKLGAASAAAADIDRMCLDVAYANAALNGIGPDTYTVRVGNVLEDGNFLTSLGGGYDIVMANIVADVIMALALPVRGLIREGGVFLCSGIIDSRAEETAAALRRAGWKITQSRERQGWYAYTCR